MNWFTRMFAAAQALPGLPKPPQTDQPPALSELLTPAPAAPMPTQQSPQNVDTSVVSVDRPQFGVFGTGFPRVNLDDLIGKKGPLVYAKMRTDEQVKAVVTFKRDAILSRGWTFEFDKDSKLSDDEKARRKRVCEQIVRQLPGSFVDALNIIAVGREYGFSLTEKVYQQITVDGQTYVGLRGLFGRDPATFMFYTDPYGDLLKCEQWVGGFRILIDLAKFVHYVHNPDFDRWFGRSDLREAYRSWYIKDQALKYWGQYLERMAGGFLVASLGPDAQIRPNTTEFTQLQTAMAQMKASAGVTMPVGVTLQAIFPQTTEAFEKACQYHDLAIAKALLVPNLMGVSNAGHTGSYAQSQTQIEAFAWTLKTDADRLESCIDEQLFRDLCEQNFGDGEYPCFTFKPLSGEQLRWIVTTWTQLVTAGTVIPTEIDEARLREILEMPPREPGDKPLVDPNLAAQRQHEMNIAKAQGAQPQEPGQQRPQSGAGYRRRMAEFGFNPEQARAPDGKWTHMTEALTKSASGTYGHDLALHKSDQNARDYLARQASFLSKSSRGRTSIVKSRITPYTHEAHASRVAELKQGRYDWEDTSQVFARHFAISKKQAQIALASARERVDFAVLDRKQTTMSDDLTAQLAQIMARSVKKELGTDEDVARLTDEDTSDIGQWQLPAVAVGKLKVTTQKALAESWALGRSTAQNEIRKTDQKFARGLFEFADLRDKAASYFESTAFKVAGDVSDRGRSVIQQELLTSVKVGRSPEQTRTAIWDRLVSKGLSSPEAVRSVETDAGVNRALDDLWKDTPEEAAAYLDTVARTNLFSAMNEARYAEFSDPALADFVLALRYSAVMDEHTTEICASLDDSVYETDNPIWDEYRPPNHFNCRSVLIPITAIDVQDGLWDQVESPEPTVQPQEGFGG